MRGNNEIGALFAQADKLERDTDPHTIDPANPSVAGFLDALKPHLKQKSVQTAKSSCATPENAILLAETGAVLDAEQLTGDK